MFAIRWHCRDLDTSCYSVSIGSAHPFSPDWLSSHVPCLHPSFWLRQPLFNHLTSCPLAALGPPSLPLIYSLFCLSGREARFCFVAQTGLELTCSSVCYWTHDLPASASYNAGTIVTSLLEWLFPMCIASLAFMWAIVTRPQNWLLKPSYSLIQEDWAELYSALGNRVGKITLSYMTWDPASTPP